MQTIQLIFCFMLTHLCLAMLRASLLSSGTYYEASFYSTTYEIWVIASSLSTITAFCLTKNKYDSKMSMNSPTKPTFWPTEVLASFAHLLSTQCILFTSASGLLKRQQQLRRIWHCSFFFNILEQYDVILLTKVS